jgi:hypothetical protein
MTSKDFGAFAIIFATFVSVFTVFAFSCDAKLLDPQAGKTSPLASSEVSYTKDTRVNVCYAVVKNMKSSGFYATAFTYVPCENVEKLAVPMD